MIVEWDLAKATSSLRKHRVDFHEAVTALEDPLSTTFPDPEHSLEERRFVTIGISGKGRVLAHMRTVAQRFASSARGVQPRASAGSMKKASRKQEDDLRPEYDSSSLKGGVRGKYYRRFLAGTNIARLEPDLARVFPTDRAVQ